MTNRISRVPLGVVALAAATLVGCSSAPGRTAGHGATETPATPRATAAPPAAHGVEASIDSVPWAQVGPGWLLATWSPVPGHAGGDTPAGAPTFATSSTTLFLVDPAGGRYPITTFPPPGEGAGPPALVDWSGDGTRALFYTSGADHGSAIEVDLRTGTQKTLSVDGDYMSARYTRPDGKALLLSKWGDVDTPAQLVRVGLDGAHQLTYPVDKVGVRFQPTYLSSPDGTELVLGTETGLAVMGNDGTPRTRLPVAGTKDCRPSRWWDQGSVVLAECEGADYTDSRLWLVPVDGTPPTALTAPTGTQGQSFTGVSGAWRLPGGTFVQALGACGHVFLTKLGDNGKLTEVSVPDVDNDDSVVVLGANGGDLQLQASVSCGSGESLVDYDPVAGTSTVLLGPTVNGGGVIEAVPYPQRP